MKHIESIREIAYGYLKNIYDLANESYDERKLKNDFFELKEIYYGFKRNNFPKSITDEIKNKLSESFEKRLSHIKKESYDLLYEFYEKFFLKTRYFMRNEPNGYGYQIIDRCGFIKVYDTYVSEKAEEAQKIIYESLEENGDLKENISELLPSTEGEIPPPKVLVYDSKHHKYHYDVSTPVLLSKTIQKILSEEIGHSFHHPGEEPTLKTGLSAEEIENLPEGTVKEFAKEELKKFNKFLEGWKENKRQYDILEKFLKVDLEKTYVSSSTSKDLLYHYLGNYVDVEELDKV
jgi:hypothetical protein